VEDEGIGYTMTSGEGGDVDRDGLDMQSERREARWRGKHGARCGPHGDRVGIVRMLRALGLERPSASRSRAPFLARALVVLKAA
jgi:hypothetical protein